MEDNQSKMASLGLISAGIAHEIQNPLNFVINFAKMSDKLLSDMKLLAEDIEGKISEDEAEELDDIIADLSVNVNKIREHGERAISIIQGILLISRGKEGEKLPTDIPKLVHEYLWLSYHAKRANDKSFNVTINEDYQEGLPQLMVIPQDLSRAVINIVNNACYAVQQREAMEREKGSDYKPFIQVKADYSDGKLTLVFKDNGTGIPEKVKQVLFREIITTKPVGLGTGLGMRITHDIVVKNHGGDITFESEEGRGTTFTIVIPCEAVKA